MPRLDLARLFDSEQARLFALCHRLTGDRGTAEDALQDTFLLAHRHLSGFRGDAGPETWLYRIAIRAATRRRERDRAERDRDRVVEPIRSGAPGDSDIEAFRKAFDALPEHHRLVLTLLALRGLPARVVGEILGVPEGTVYSRSHAARAALRKELAPHARPGSDDEPAHGVGNPHHKR
ncbi:MAG: RNA polymerase sigma factor [Planctomycetota bacterium]